MKEKAKKIVAFRLCASDEGTWLQQDRHTNSPTWNRAANIVEKALSTIQGGDISISRRTAARRWVLNDSKPCGVEAALRFCRVAVMAFGMSGLGDEYKVYCPDFASWPPNYTLGFDMGTLNDRVDADVDGYIVSVTEAPASRKRKARAKAVEREVVEMESPKDTCDAEPDEATKAAWRLRDRDAALDESIAVIRADLDANQISDAVAVMKLASAVARHGATFRRTIFEQVVSGIARG